MPYEIPRTEFTPHPIGQFTGKITELRDKGIQKNFDGVDQHRLMMVLESREAKMESGLPFALYIWYNLSSAPTANLTKLRHKIAGRNLTEEELSNFDENKELIGMHVGYVVTHAQKQDGSTKAVLDAIWPLGTRDGAAPDPEDDEPAVYQQEQPAPTGQPVPAPQNPLPAKLPSDDDLPF